MEEVTKQMSDLTVVTFRKLEEIKRLARHFRNLINHPDTAKKPIVLDYFKALESTHKSIYTQKREGVEVEYIFTTEKKSSVQRQRFNSLPISEVPELLKAELATLACEDARQVHICTDCDVEIELNDEVPLMESLQKHFSLEIHLPKMKRESVDVAEPIVLPNMSRRMSAMECGEVPVVEQRLEKLDRGFSSKLETQLIRHLPDNSEASIDAAMKFFQSAYDKLCTEVGTLDFSALTGAVAPIIMSIKDNVNQSFAAELYKNYEIDENEAEKNKGQAKKYRFYGPIESFILKLLSSHKLLSLTDDRTGKPAFFCMACEYYTLRFRYDSVLNHVFSDTHVHNLSCILQADSHIPFALEERTATKIKEMNSKFLESHSILDSEGSFECGLCNETFETMETTVLHVLDEIHLGKMSDKIYRKAKTTDAISEDWGPKSLDWAKFLAVSGKALTNRDNVVIENFIKPSGKIANYCSCCDMTLKGPRQVLFNHIRQKKHLRNAAPHKLALLFKNHCRPTEYYASFGNYYICTICPKYVALPSFAAIVGHFESNIHLESIAKFVRAALYPESADTTLLAAQKVDTETLKCTFCNLTFENASSLIEHVLTNIQHHNAVADAIIQANKGDVISVYMNGNFILHSEGSTFDCTSCKGVFKSLRSLLTHLVFAEHFADKPSSENVFRFYLELKHNIALLVRNKYEYYEFGKLKCGACARDVLVGENAKKHVMSQAHRESMGVGFPNAVDPAVE